ncbi:DUF1684 domain-containing protein [Paramicrobacterium chengjingii]|uniref:DUF1684 domain-containing protein n=1 Tax=Paramicrobacterium chengjingii TaxID=2769067 RepID=A0ABX6YE68_9MICO|nr:DUF1684 domain-containing protein [Microbacterium chengjingii]QPZ37093.1 DUF1684 domain-containing protein [Microbacterium chengjingii]
MTDLERFRGEWSAWRRERDEQMADARSPLGFVWGAHVTAADTEVPPAPGRWAPLEGGRGLGVTAEASDGIRINGELVDGHAALYWLAVDGPTEATFADGSIGVVFSYDGTRFALQIWNAASERRQRFDHIDSFTYDARWVVPARIKQPSVGRTVAISHYRDPEPIEVPVVAEIVLTIEERYYILQATEHEGTLTIPFRDQTNGVSSYGSGRVLDLPLDGPGAVKVGDVAFIDLNRARLLPCAFSPAWNCPLPPGDNVLPVVIDAGEKWPVDAAGRPFDQD